MSFYLLRGPFVILFAISTFYQFGCDNKRKEKVDQANENIVTAKETEEKNTILFFGNSITAGYGVEPSQAFPALIQHKLDSLGLPWQVVNAGLSGETTASGKNRVDWILKQPVDIFVLELGGNDGLRGIPMDETRANLLTIIQRVRKSYPEVQILLTGMQIPPNMGPEYTREFQQVFEEVAEQTGVHFMPFLLEGVGGEPDLNQEDGIHPNARGHQVVAQQVWEELQPLLNSNAG